jgi:hypothetical protein
MNTRLYARLAIVALTAWLGSTLQAQSEIWLQYHTDRQQRGYHPIELIAEKPDPPDVPAFKSAKPSFARWTTPMDKQGFRWLALDRSQKSGPADLLYLDANGDGKLSDEPPIKAYHRDANEARFGPVKILFDGEDGKVTYHLNLVFRQFEGSRERLYAHAGGWYEGFLPVGSGKKRCVLFDNNANGTFNDQALESQNADTLQIGREGAETTFMVGKFLEIEDTLYRLEVARDGAFVKLSKAEGIQFGQVKLPDNVTELAAGGTNGLFYRKPVQGKVTLPWGKYHIHHWNSERRDDQGAKWTLAGLGSDERGDFEVTVAAMPCLQIGEPITASLQVTEASDKTLSFRLTLEGQLGESINLTRENARPRAPQLVLKGKNNRFAKTLSFEYG